MHMHTLLLQSRKKITFMTLLTSQSKTNNLKHDKKLKCERFVRLNPLLCSNLCELKLVVESDSVENLEDMSELLHRYSHFKGVTAFTVSSQVLGRLLTTLFALQVLDDKGRHYFV